jgi:hypothetical protein
MLKFHESALTIFAVFITTPTSLFSPVVVIGLSLVCVTTVAFTLFAALRRNHRPVRVRATLRNPLARSR